jgi:hypothetical protein
VLQAGQVRGPGRDVGGSVITERFDVDQIKSAFGLGGWVVARDRS